MKHFLKPVIISICALSFFVLLGYLSQIPSVRQQLALATTIKPETFTELYLENHQTLPRSVEESTAQTFSFTIHNLEYKTMTYPYEVYIQDMSGKKAIITKDIVRLRHDEKKTIPVYYELLQQVTRAKVVVHLISKQQEVHFWIGEDPDTYLKNATMSAQIDK